MLTYPGKKSSLLTPSAPPRYLPKSCIACSISQGVTVYEMENTLCTPEKGFRAPKKVKGGVRGKSQTHCMKQTIFPETGDINLKEFKIKYLFNFFKEV